MGGPVTSFPVPGYQLGLSLRLQRFGVADPTFRMEEDVVVRAFWTPEGACTLALRQQGAEVLAETVGPGADWCRAWLPRMFAFAPQELPATCSHRGLRETARRLPGLKIGPVPWPFDVCVAYIFQQRVAFRDASRSYRQLVQRFGERAPGPLELRLPLAPARWLEIGLNQLQRAGLDEKRAATVLRVARLGLQLTPEELARQRGIGPWTLESVKGFGFGDPDAVPTGDLHLPHVICQALGGLPRGDDATMLELLEPYRGVRFRVVNWVMRATYQRAHASPEG